MDILIINQDTDEAYENGDKHVYLEGVHWTKTELLGTGAFSSCYSARDKCSGTLMAVKQVLYFFRLLVVFIVIHYQTEGEGAKKG